jgi:hypothetical protein
MPYSESDPDPFGDFDHGRNMTAIDVLSGEQIPSLSDRRAGELFPSVQHRACPRHFRKCFLADREARSRGTPINRNDHAKQFIASCRTGDAILGPWSTVLWLALQSNEVIGLRVGKFAGGGVEAQREARIIVSEKVDAIFGVSARLMSGTTAMHVISRFREQAAANARRLSAVSLDA